MSEEHNLKKIKLEKENKKECDEELEGKIKELVPLSKLDKDTFGYLYKLTHLTFYNDYVYYIDLSYSKSSGQLDSFMTTNEEFSKITTFIISDDIDKINKIKEDIITYLEKVEFISDFIRNVCDFSFETIKPLTYAGIVPIAEREEFEHNEIANFFKYQISTSFSKRDEFIYHNDCELYKSLNKYDFEDFICKYLLIEGRDQKEETRFIEKRKKLKKL